MKRMVFFVAALFLCSTVLVSDANIGNRFQNNDPPKEKTDPKPEQDEWCGVYECKGVGTNGVEYECIVIIRRDSPVYIVQHVAGADLIIGAGQLDGDRLSVGWAYPSPGVQTGMVRGVTVYEKRKGGLKGSYVAIPSNKSKGTEDLTRIKSFAKGV